MVGVSGDVIGAGLGVETGLLDDGFVIGDGFVRAGVGVDAGLIGVLVVGFGFGFGVTIGFEGATRSLGVGEVIVPPGGLGELPRAGLAGGLGGKIFVLVEGLAELLGVGLATSSGLEPGDAGGLAGGEGFVLGEGLARLAEPGLEPPTAPPAGEDEFVELFVELFVDVEELEPVDEELEVELLEVGEPGLTEGVSDELDELEVPEPLELLEVDPEDELESIVEVVPLGKFGTVEVPALPSLS